MRNRKYYPFERNSYYFGKLLTARDFEAEQRYFNDKRRFINRLTGANGIVAGLGVIKADDASIILQTGCAFDASGREIVVPETRVIKLSTIDGYSLLTSQCAYLGISYDEQPADEVYSVMSDEQGETRYNKVCERYRLTLLDESLVDRIVAPIEEFVASTIIYADQDVRVVQKTPRFLTKGSNLTVQIEIARTAPGSGEYSFTYTLDTPGLRGAQGQITEVAVNNLKLFQGENHVLEYTLHPEAYVYGGGTNIDISDFVIRKGDESFHLNQKLEVSIKAAGQTLSEFYLANYYARSMDKTLGESYDERLWIGKINLLRHNTSVLIDSVSPAPFGQYSYNPQQLMMLRQLESFYPSVLPERTSLAEPARVTASVATEQAEQTRTTASGVFTMALGLGYTASESIFSEEIMHGLGKGPVYVDVGVEYITADESKGNSSSEILLGDISIFGQEDDAELGEKLYDVSTGVKVLPERGTFVVGLKLKDPRGLISLRIRWFAMRLGEVAKQIKSSGNQGERMLMVNPDTIVLSPKGTAHISPVFINMPTEACAFRVLDPEGGTIDQNGLYTAPAREGVYEIRTEAISDPTIYTHVFAIVTQKKKD